MMRRLVRQARSRQERCSVEPLMAITGHRGSTMRASIMPLDHRGQALAAVPVEDIEFELFAVDSPDKA
jgi:hypothetical protein